MCDHPKTAHRLVESARKKGYHTRPGEQFLRCRECGDTRIAYTPKPD